MLVHRFAFVLEGDETALLSISGASEDPNADSHIVALPIKIIDNDLPSVLINEGDGLSVAEEDETSDQYTVVLTHEPTGTVTIDFVTDTGQLTVAPASLDFNQLDYDSPKPVTVTAVDDTDAEANPHVVEIAHTATSPGDQRYHGLSIESVSVSISENDCGDGPFDERDYNTDCIVNIADLAYFAGGWLDCSVDGLCD